MSRTEAESPEKFKRQGDKVLLALNILSSLGKQGPHTQPMQISIIQIKSMAIPSFVPSSAVAQHAFFNLFIIYR